MLLVAQIALQSSPQLENYSPGKLYLLLTLKKQATLKENTKGEVVRTLI